MAIVTTADLTAKEVTAPPSVLVADDDSDLCDLYRLFFSRHGWRVEVSGDGVACLARMRRSLPQVLILDLQLLWGGSDGLLAVMRDDPDLAEVPVILTSTAELPETDSRLMSPPVVQALGKPFSLTKLLQSACGLLPKI